MDGILPWELMECILLILPVSSLLRFRAVCKSWNHTISSHPFSVAYLYFQRTNTNNLFLFPCPVGTIMYHQLIQLQLERNPRLQTVAYPDIHECPPEISEEYCRNLCYSSDSLILVQVGYYNDVYAIWNSWTKSCIKFTLPCHFRGVGGLFYGLCYDSLVEDYKVVVTDMRQYVVFHCRNMSWTKLRDAFDDIHVPSFKNAVIGGLNTSNGDFYWLLRTNRQSQSHCDYEVVCFDPREEKLKKLPRPPGQQAKRVQRNWVRFSSVSTHLCLHRTQIVDGGRPLYQSFLLKKDGDEYSWAEFVLHVPSAVTSSRLFPVHVASENMIILQVVEPLKFLPNGEQETYFVCYNTTEKTFTRIDKDSIIKRVTTYPSIPFTANLFFMRKKRGIEN